MATAHSRGFVCFYGRPGQLVVWCAAALLAWVLVVSAGPGPRWWWSFAQAHAVVDATPCGQLSAR